MAARKTNRVPRSQRKRPGIELTLSPKVRAFLKSKKNASEWVDQLILDACPEIERKDEDSSREPREGC